MPRPPRLPRSHARPGIPSTPTASCRLTTSMQAIRTLSRSAPRQARLVAAPQPHLIASFAAAAPVRSRTALFSTSALARKEPEEGVVGVRCHSSRAQEIVSLTGRGEFRTGARAERVARRRRPCVRTRRGRQAGGQICCRGRRGCRAKGHRCASSFFSQIPVRSLSARTSVHEAGR